MARTRPVLVALALTVAAALPLAPARASGPDCGGDAFSRAEVVEGRRAARPRRGPLTSVPDTLCADLADERPWRVEIEAGPPLGEGDAPRPAPRRGRDGGSGPGALYRR